MKRGCLEHPKFKRLVRRLDINAAWVAGILESLWQFTGKFAKAGDIGRFSDQDIAEACFWSADPATLINALIEENWLDRHKQHRLVIHGWSEHCDDATHMALGRAGERFADGTTPKLSRLSQKEREAAEAKFAHPTHGVHTASTCCGVAPPSPPIPSPALPSHPLLPASKQRKPSKASPAPRITWSPAASWSGITVDHRTGWTDAYPNIDIDGQLKRMHVWLLANPDKRPRSNFARFIVNWLGNERPRGDQHHNGNGHTDADGLDSCDKLPTLEEARRRLQEAGAA